VTDRPEEALQNREEGERPVIRDRRRIDPETGQLREPQHRAAAPEEPDTSAGGPSEADIGNREAELEQSLAELTTDLKRLQAEYLNYKRRVDRDRVAVREAAVGAVLTALLPVLDDIDRARDHGELDGGFKAVADSFDRILAGLGLERFGESGEEFDPRIHEALMHAYDDGVDGPTCREILQPGYRIGDRVLRPARVSVVEPTAALNDVPEAAEGPAAAPSAEPATDADEQD
jgi:molecular chaperone GrpE